MDENNYIYNITLGVIIGTFIGYIISKNYIKTDIIHGPNSSYIRSKLYKYNDEYYRFIPYAVIGPIR